MKPTLLARLGGLAMVSVTAFAGVSSPTGTHSYSFSAALTGDVRATISGSAAFGRVAAGAGKPTVFTLSLGADSSEGAVLFTRTSGIRPSVGSYQVSDLGAGSDDLQALVMLGRADHPAGVFRAQSGTLTVTSVSDNGVSGIFALHATGFLADQPNRENQRVFVQGSFSAKGSN
jgi:hypothetical protein